MDNNCRWWARIGAHLTGNSHPPLRRGVECTSVASAAEVFGLGWSLGLPWPHQPPFWGPGEDCEVPSNIRAERREAAERSWLRGERGCPNGPRVGEDEEGWEYTSPLPCKNE